MTRKTKPKSTDANPTAIVQIQRQPNKTREQMLAQIATAGLLSNATTMVTFSAGTMGELSLTDCLGALNESTTAVHSGDLKASETMLHTQAVALNSIFTELARRAALNMGEYIGAMETYLRLALKAQSQCARTIETLAAIKNPPVVFAKQANIAHGPQQVNNGPQPAPIAQAHTHAGNSSIERNELLETSNGQRLDTAATGATSATHQDVEAVGAVNRAKD